VFFFFFFMSLDDDDDFFINNTLRYNNYTDKQDFTALRQHASHSSNPFSYLDWFALMYELHSK